MTENLRRHPRKEIEIEVELRFLKDDAHTATTRNMSEGGLFMCVKNPKRYPMGEIISLRFKNPLNDFCNTEKDAVIVRHSEDGIAVAFIEMDEA